MTLDAHFVVRRPAHTTTIDLDAHPGETVGLIGPNGAGKSTTLRALAGLLPVDEGTICVDGAVLSSTAVHVPAYQRSVGFVFQDHLLFPHLNAIDNVAFGLRSAGVPRKEARARSLDWLGRLGIEDLADRRSRQLSGGQAQRVAIARALAAEPQMLLLDEPTASLDASGAMALRTQLREHLQAFAGVSILVTHTALDAMVMTDRLVVLDQGSIVQTGTPAEVAARPRTHHVAALVGLNLVRGISQSGVIALANGGSLVAAEQVTGQAFAAFSPASVSLFEEAPTGSPRNVWPGTVTSIAPHGDAVRVQVEAAVPLLADITPAALATLALKAGSPVWASVKATEVSIYLD
ncbi:MAG: ABC transporter ATP-binding protein [Nocardioidaceae bacterium]